ncbi:MAG: hypothetical protein Q4E60_10570 [Bacteroidales bacterium]|nr:hypothetical protein [Bacteroidales bacterium]
MKKLFSIFLSGLAIASTTLSFQSCADEYDPAIVTKHDMAVNEYTENFIKHYGDIDPNHTWGFEATLPVMFGSKALTRAEGGGAGSVDTGRNQWTEKDNNGYKETALARTVTIPGWPNFDGYYYTDHGIFAEEPTNSNYLAVGDVTEFEVLFVSNYFRTHPTKESMKSELVDLHLTDFFVQDVCSDADQVEYLPPYGSGANQDEILGETGQAQNFGMDQLRFKTINSTNYDADNHKVDGTWTHINNFNRMTQNFDPENHAGNNSQRTIMFVSSSGTEDFAYHSSFNDTDAFFNKWVLVRLTWQEVGQDGNLYAREGYYLAFDYETFKGSKGQYYEADGYFSNWIIKITPAYTKDAPETKRVMCEDLGNTYDFDFNDVVFDAYATKIKNTSEYEWVITLQAAGGTMPIYVGIDPDGDTPNKEVYEAHKMLGQSTTSVPVNVGNGATHSVANYRIPATPSGDSYGTPVFNADDIKVYVKNGSSKYVVGAENRGNTQHPNPTGEGYTGEQYKGKDLAPQKFAVPTSVQWMKECQFIEWGYPDFKNWVSDAENHKEWYKTGVDPSFIYEYRVENHPTTSQPEGATNPNLTLTIGIEPTEGGTVTCSNYQITNNQISGLIRSSMVKLTAVPAEGYRFKAWEDGSTNAERTVFVLQNTTVKATFELDNGNNTEDNNGDDNNSSNAEISTSNGVITITNITPGKTTATIPAETINSILGENNSLSITINFDGSQYAGGTLQAKNPNDQYNNLSQQWATQNGGALTIDVDSSILNSIKSGNALTIAFHNTNNSITSATIQVKQ